MPAALDAVCALVTPWNEVSDGDLGRWMAETQGALECERTSRAHGREDLRIQITARAAALSQ